ncbi:MAG TPA: hypothetical protein DER40_10590 [Geobacter sp.]|nr:hypothetical protein [Geobacter sp.]
MQRILRGLIGLLILLGPVTYAKADISVGIGLPNVSIGINLPLFPHLIPVPGYPVYYAPSVEANYFFYDGMYWIYQGDGWYSSSWYNGPWWPVEPAYVPLFILRIPVSYYRQPPVYFQGWQSNAPPRWGQHWGHEWEQRHSGWDRWRRSSVPARAPLPVYQRKYSGERYPHQVEQQHKLRTRSYRYQPKDKIVRQHFKQQTGQKAPAPVQQRRQPAPAVRAPNHQDQPRPAPRQQVRPQVQHPQPQAKPQAQHPQPQARPQVQHPQPPQHGIKPAPVKPAQVHPAPQHQGPAVRDQRQQPAPAAHQQKPQPAPAQHQQQDPRAKGQGQRPNEPQGGGQGQNRDDDRGRGRDK